VEPLQGPFAWITNDRYEQPAKDQKVLRLGTTKVPLERVEHLLYLAWDACATPQVSRSWAFWDVGCIQNTQERSYFQGFFRDAHTAEVSSPVTFEQIGLIQGKLPR
jgi:hypothetical protein